MKGQDIRVLVNQRAVDAHPGKSNTDGSIGEPLFQEWGLISLSLLTKNTAESRPGKVAAKPLTLSMRDGFSSLAARAVSSCGGEDCSRVCAGISVGYGFFCIHSS